LEVEFAGRVQIAWRSFLLRPEPGSSRDLERFRAYTEGWSRPAAERDAGRFQVWRGDAGPPSASLPPHLAARAAAELGRAAFDAMHERLFHAYFAESRDISDRETLHALWSEAGLSEAAFGRCDDSDIRDSVLADHREALALGIHGVPAVRIEPNTVAAVGAQPLDAYRHWFLKQLGEDR
jgi:predicted DsbA family dithiol-disulfide isomerase